MERKSIPTKFEIQAKERIRWIIDNFCDGSQQALVDRTGVGKASISQYVNGKNIPSNLTAKKICSPFGLNPAWLMGFDVPMECEPLPDCSISYDSAAKTQRSLTPDQQELLADYEKLNEKGKAKVREYASDLTEQGKYTQAYEQDTAPSRLGA